MQHNPQENPAGCFLAAPADQVQFGRDYISYPPGSRRDEYMATGDLESLQALAKQGLSPSSLGQYIRNPIDFYNQKILGLKENNALEETVEATTFGSVVHYTLEALYKPFVGQLLDIQKLLALKPKIEPTVRQFFKELYKKGDISRGKNLISFEIAKRYILNFLDHEIEFLKNGHKNPFPESANTPE